MTTPRDHITQILTHAITENLATYGPHTTPYDLALLVQDALGVHGYAIEWAPVDDHATQALIADLYTKVGRPS